MGCKPLKTCAMIEAPTDSRQKPLFLNGVKAIRTPEIMSINMPRIRPNPAPNTRSKGESPTTATSFLTDTASKPPAKIAKTNTQINPAPKRTGSLAPAIGNIIPISWPQTWAAINAPNHEARESSSKTSPLQTPSKKESSKTVKKNQSSTGKFAIVKNARGN